MNEDKDREQNPPRDGYFGWPEDQDVMYGDEHGNPLTPAEFREHLKYLSEHETEEEREARYQHVRDTERKLLGDEIAEMHERERQERDRERRERDQSEG